MADVDLRQLAITRNENGGGMVRARRHVLTRYVFPVTLVVGFLGLLAWASWDVVFPPQEVTVVPVYASESAVQQQGTPLFKAAGWIEPRPTPIRIAALAPGVVAELLVVEDQPVKAGEAIAILIKEDAQLAYERALADQSLREAEVEEAQAALHASTTRFEQPVHLEAALAEAEAALAKISTELVNLPFATRRATAQLEYARANYEGKVSAKGAISVRLIDAARSELESAQALVDELRDRAASLAHEQDALQRRRDALSMQLELLADERQARDTAAARLAAARARMEQARVMVAEAQLRLDRMTVRSPTDGRVYQLVAEPGTTLTGGMGRNEAFDGSTVITLYRPRSLQVRVDVRFEDIPKVALGQVVEIDNPALRAPLEGRVLFISSEADIQKNTLQVKVDISSPAEVFKPEMLVDVTFLAPPEAGSPTEATARRRLYVPARLLQSDEAGSFLWMADLSAGIARRVRVQTGSASGNGLVEIVEGISMGQHVIASGQAGLANGDRIRVTGEDLATLGDGLAIHESARSAMHRLPQRGDE